jgi:hypothetical protein
MCVHERKSRRGARLMPRRVPTGKRPNQRRTAAMTTQASCNSARRARLLAPWYLRVVVAVVASLGIAAGAHAAININQHGLTGTWANPETDGQGMIVELFPDLLGAGTGYVFGAWYTYDTTPGGSDHNRWYTYQASVSDGSSSADVVIYRSTGGTFVAAGGTTTEPVGTGTIAFASCTSGSFTYTLDDGRSGTIPLVRLMQNAECINPPPPLINDFGLSGSWADSTTSAQGMLIEVNPGDANIFLGWFTFAAAPGDTRDAVDQRWFTAQSPYTVGDRSFALDLYETTGGTFDQAGIVQTKLVGTAQLTFSSCEDADFEYAFTNGELQGRSGILHLSRIAFVPSTCSF